MSQKNNRQKTDSKRKAPKSAWKPGQCGNPNGRPKLPEEIKSMKDASLQKAIEILHDKLHSKVWLRKCRNSDLNKFLETTFDRFGLPKVTKNEVEGNLTFTQMAPVKIGGKAKEVNIG